MQNDPVMLLKKAKETRSPKHIKAFHTACIKHFSSLWHAHAASFGKQMAKDVVQDFLAYKFLKKGNLDKYPYNCNEELLKYTLRMLKNHCYDYFKTKGRRADLFQRNKERINPDQAGRIPLSDRVILGMDIGKALNSLKEESQRQAMGLFLIGYRYKEIAKKMGKTENAVRNLIYRARQNLSDFFDQ